ncbi:MAG: phage holin family protein [Myxococcota bacterium]
MSQAALSELIQTLGREGKAWIEAEGQRIRLEVEGRSRSAGGLLAQGAFVLTIFAIGLSALLMGLINWLALFLGRIIAPAVVGFVLLVGAGIMARGLIKQARLSLPAPKELTDGRS